MTKRRRTKIVATVGPSLDNPEILDKTIKAGADVFRCNFSHDIPEKHKKRVEMIRELAKKNGKEVAIVADLQGPKIRISRFKDKSITLKEGDEFTLDSELGINDGDQKQVGIDYKELTKDVHSGDTLLLDDGRLVLSVKDVKGTKIFCTVKTGGVLSNNKGINKLGGGLSAKAITEKDKADLKFAATLDVDYFAMSFPRSASDIEEAKSLIKEAKSKAGVIAKIERAEAIEPKTLDEIIDASDAIMVARGDLGVEVDDSKLPAIQKYMIQRTNALNKPVITATQMMETMIHNTIPTRAEVFDVANAVFDDTDAVMLSAETSTGDHPHIVVAAMARICFEAEQQIQTQISSHRLEERFENIDETIAMSTMYAANHLDVKAIVCLTETGKTPLLMSRIRSGIPIFGLTRNVRTQRKMALYRGVYPMEFDVTKADPVNIPESVVNVLKNKGIVKKGDIIIITRGKILGKQGLTDLMKIYKV